MLKSHFNILTLRLRCSGSMTLQDTTVCLTRAQDISILAVHCIVAQKHLFFSHPQRDPQHMLDEKQDQAGPHKIPSNDEACSGHLVAQLHAITCDRDRKSVV